MVNPLNLLAFDLGSSNGRGILGRFDGQKITLEELHRFENGYVEMNNMFFWDVLNIFSNMKQVFQKFKHIEGGQLACFGIDSWGNDFGLIDKNGHMLSYPRSARHTTVQDMNAVHQVVPGIELFHRTGLASYSINSLYQLYRRKREADPALENARAMLMIPDLLAFYCTGEKHSEYTISTTTMLYNPHSQTWDYKTMQELGLPEHIMQPILPSATLCGSLSPSIQNEVSINAVPYALVGSHDTASAVAAIPALDNETDYAFCSSGTWSLLGMETPCPIFSDDGYQRGYSNEGTVQGGYRLLNNITGLWLLQECRKEWAKSGVRLSYSEIDEMVATAKPLTCFIDPNHRSLFEVGNTATKIQKLCVETKQPVPVSQGEIARCIYESLALKYRQVIEFLDKTNGKPITHLYIVGGGTQSKVFNQMIADAINRPVLIGPAEGACVGNLLTQAMALGEISNLNELRQVVRNSFPIETYVPADPALWDDAYLQAETLFENNRRKQ